MDAAIAAPSPLQKRKNTTEEDKTWLWKNLIPENLFWKTHSK